MLNKIFNPTLSQKIFKKFFLRDSIKVGFFFFKGKKLLLLKNKVSFFFFLPAVFSFVLKRNVFFAYNKSAVPIKYKDVYFFLVHLNACINQLNRVSTTTFYIRGVGLKISWRENLRTHLHLRVGYSHPIFLHIPASILMTTILKKKIIFSSFSKVLLGNFTNFFFKYRPINIFTGKGLLKKQKAKFKIKGYIKKL